VKTREQLEIDLRKWLQRYYSVIGHAEALAIGASWANIEAKRRHHEWAELYRLVYRDTASSTDPHQNLRAACVATKTGVASHASAAWHWGLLDRPPKSPEVTVSIDSRFGAGQPRLTIHRSRDLEPAATTIWKNIPVTKPLRTLVDLAGTATPEVLTEAVDNAVARRLVTPAGLEAEIGRLSRRGRIGVGLLRCHLDERGFAGAPAPSVLEAHARRLIVRSGLPIPLVEQRVGTDLSDYRVDMIWDSLLLISEVDGHLWHFSPEHKERDENRRNDLRQNGWTVLVYNWRQVIREPTWVTNQIVATHRRLAQSTGATLLAVEPG
jgi:very-short-patch-repair endonuclease